MRERIVFAHDLGASPYLLEDPETTTRPGVAKRWKADSGGQMARYADRLAGHARLFFRPGRARPTCAPSPRPRVSASGLVVHPARLALTRMPLALASSRR